MVLSAQYKRSRGADVQRGPIMSAQHQLSLHRVITAECCGERQCGARKILGSMSRKLVGLQGKLMRSAHRLPVTSPPKMQYCTIFPVFCKAPVELYNVIGFPLTKCIHLSTRREASVLLYTSRCCITGN